MFVLRLDVFYNNFVFCCKSICTLKCDDLTTQAVINCLCLQQAIEEYHDEISLDYGWKDSRSVTNVKNAKIRLVSKLHACGCTADHIEQIVDTECP